MNFFYLMILHSYFGFSYFRNRPILIHQTTFMVFSSSDEDSFRLTFTL